MLPLGKRVKDKRLFDSKSDNLDLVVFGRSSALINDEDMADYANSDNSLLPWNDDSSLMMDRYDARHLLDDLKCFSRKRTRRFEITDENEAQIESERYFDLNSSCVPEEDLNSIQDSSINEISSRGAYSNVPFSYEYLSTEKEKTKTSPIVEDNEGTISPESVFQPPFSVPDYLQNHLPPTEKLHQIISKTAKFVVEKGGQAEIILRVKQANNPNFKFLNHDHFLQPYFRFLLNYPEHLENKKEENKELERVSMPSSFPTSSPNVSTPSLNPISLLSTMYGEEDEDDEEDGVDKDKEEEKHGNNDEVKRENCVKEDIKVNVNEIKQVDDKKIQIDMNNEFHSNNKKVNDLRKEDVHSPPIKEDLKQPYPNILSNDESYARIPESSSKLTIKTSDFSDEPLPPGMESSPPLINPISNAQIQQNSTLNTCTSTTIAINNDNSNQTVNHNWKYESFSTNQSMLNAMHKNQTVISSTMIQPNLMQIQHPIHQQSTQPQIRQRTIHHQPAHHQPIHQQPIHQQSIQQQSMTVMQSSQLLIPTHIPPQTKQSLDPSPFFQPNQVSIPLPLSAPSPVSVSVPFSETKQWLDSAPLIQSNQASVSASFSASPPVSVPVSVSVSTPVHDPTSMKQSFDSAARMQSDQIKSSQASFSVETPVNETKKVIHKIVEYVVKNGRQFESVILQRDAVDCRFPFLRPGHMHHGYYLDCLNLAFRSKSDNILPNVKANQTNDQIIKEGKEDTPSPILSSKNIKQENIETGKRNDQALKGHEDKEMITFFSKEDGKEGKEKEKNKSCNESVCSLTKINVEDSQKVSNSSSLSSAASPSLPSLPSPFFPSLPSPTLSSLPPLSRSTNALSIDTALKDNKSSPTKEERKKAERLKKAKLFTSMLKRKEVGSVKENEHFNQMDEEKRKEFELVTQKAELAKRLLEEKSKSKEFKTERDFSRRVRSRREGESSKDGKEGNREKSSSQILSLKKEKNGKENRTQIPDDIRAKVRAMLLNV